MFYTKSLEKVSPRNVGGGLAPQNGGKPKNENSEKLKSAIGGRSRAKPSGGRSRARPTPRDPRGHNPPTKPTSRPTHRPTNGCPKGCRRWVLSLFSLCLARKCLRRLLVANLFATSKVRCACKAGNAFSKPRLPSSLDSPPQV